jgi:hypothetical protein
MLRWPRWRFCEASHSGGCQRVGGHFKEQGQVPSKRMLVMIKSALDAITGDWCHDQLLPG